MRMKEDAMNNGQAKPGYNLQIGTESQFILDFSLFQSPETLLPWFPSSICCRTLPQTFGQGCRRFRIRFGRELPTCRKPVLPLTWNTTDSIVNSACYKARRCEECPLRGSCFKAKGGRIVEVNHRLNEYRRKAGERLISEDGIRHWGRRCIEPEAVFGQMKYNMAYRRFRHLGIDKVKMDFVFFAIAFNLKKMCSTMAKSH